MEGLARYHVELSGTRPEREVEELTASLRARVSVLSDLEVVLYFALLLGPQAMSDCLLGALQQRARSTHRFAALDQARLSCPRLRCPPCRLGLHPQGLAAVGYPPSLPPAPQ